MAWFYIKFISYTNTFWNTLTPIPFKAGTWKVLFKSFMEELRKDTTEAEQILLSTWNLLNDSFENGFASINSHWDVTYINKAAKSLFEPFITSDNMSFWELFKMIIPERIKKRYYESEISELPGIFIQYWEQLDTWYICQSWYANNELSLHIKSSKVTITPGSRTALVKELYNFISDISSECLWDWDLNSQEVFWVDGGHKNMFGYKMDNTLMSQTFWLNRIHPDDKKGVIEKIKDLRASIGNATWDCAYRFRKMNGDYCYVHDRGHIVLDEQRKAIRVFVATQNETKQFLLEKKLLETNRNLSLIVEQTVNAIIITDNDGNIKYVNKAFTTTTGYEPVEVYGKNPGSLLQGEETSVQTIEYIRTTIKNHLPFTCQILNYTKSGQKFWIYLQGQPFGDGLEDNYGYFSVQTDITEQIRDNQKLVTHNKLNQLEITKAVLKALENERNEIGKEIHDNLNHILVASKLYLDLAKSNDTNRELYLEKSSEYIGHVIENIRSISKKLVTPDLMGLRLSIKTLLDDLKLAYPIKFVFSSRHIEETELSENLKLNLFRIIQEQLTNIIKHSQAKKATIRINRISDLIILVVKDNGVGCDLSQRPNGVGLRNIRSRAALFEGSLDIKSKPNSGFQLIVTFKINVKG